MILSIAVASVNGYALVNWRFKGSEVFFTILIFGSFIPYQVMLYPIVIILRNGNLWDTLGLVLVHTIFGMPILTLLFRNYFPRFQKSFSRQPVWMVRAFGESTSNYAADESANLCGCCHSAGHWNLE